MFGEMIQFDLRSYFSNGWFNHQVDTFWIFCIEDFFWGKSLQKSYDQKDPHFRSAKSPLNKKPTLTTPPTLLAWPLPFFDGRQCNHHLVSGPPAGPFLHRGKWTFWNQVWRMICLFKEFRFLVHFQGDRSFFGEGWNNSQSYGDWNNKPTQHTRKGMKQKGESHYLNLFPCLWKMDTFFPTFWNGDCEV